MQRTTQRRTRNTGRYREVRMAWCWNVLAAHVGSTAWTMLCSAVLAIWVAVIVAILVLFRTPAVSRRASLSRPSTRGSVRAQRMPTPLHGEDGLGSSTARGHRHRRGSRSRLRRSRNSVKQLRTFVPGDGGQSSAGGKSTAQLSVEETSTGYGGAATTTGCGTARTASASDGGAKDTRLPPPAL